jgi:hypothetical protein
MPKNRVAGGESPSSPPAAGFLPADGLFAPPRQPLAPSPPPALPAHQSLKPFSFSFSAFFSFSYLYLNILCTKNYQNTF